VSGTLTCPVGSFPVGTGASTSSYINFVLIYSNFVGERDHRMGVTRPWPNRAAIEQDLLLARTVIAIYDDPLLAGELVFRGGTCFHQVHLPAPLRYCEDLDFVAGRTPASGRSSTIFEQRCGSRSGGARHLHLTASEDAAPVPSGG